MSWAPSQVLAKLLRRDVAFRSSQFRAAMSYFVRTHGSKPRPMSFAALTEYVGSAEEQDFNEAVAEIFRTGSVFMETPARDSADALHKYGMLWEFYSRMNIEDPKQRIVTMQYDKLMAWLEALDADLDRFDLTVGRWWRAGEPAQLTIDGKAVVFENKQFHPVRDASIAA